MRPVTSIIHVINALSEVVSDPFTPSSLIIETKNLKKIYVLT